MRSLFDILSNTLYKLSGEDYTIIRKCQPKVRYYFLAIGAFVLAVLICCFVSALSFTENLFHNVIADVGIGMVWGYVVTNLYVLLLYTITPTLLPVKERKKSAKKTQAFRLNVSLVLRILLVLLLAIITAQPLNILLLRPDTTTYTWTIKELMSSHAGAWFITAFVILIFLLPIYWKYSIRNLVEFYEEKAKIKRWVIEDEYRNCKILYRQILEEKLLAYNKRLMTRLDPLLYQLERINDGFQEKIKQELALECAPEDVNKYEYWADPPYRTQHKKWVRNALSEAELLRIIYSSDH